MLDLIEHLAGGVQGVPILILCLARADLLDERPNWGGGKVRASTIELQALPPRRQRAARRRARPAASRSCSPPNSVPPCSRPPRAIRCSSRRRCGCCSNPTIRAAGIPPTVQAMIAARIDRLPRAEKAVLRRAAVAGRVFWSGAVEAMTDDDGGRASGWTSSSQRDFLVREQRSTIRGEEAYRFKHVLIRDVAYAGLSKSSRGAAAPAAGELARGARPSPTSSSRSAPTTSTRRRSSELELEGRVPAELAADAAAALEHAGLRAHAREANRAARRLLVRAVELEPTLERRYLAARAAWRMTDIPTLSTEMEVVREAAHEAGDARIEGRALTGARAGVALPRRRQRPRPRARHAGARRDRGDRRGRALRRVGAARHGRLVGGRSVRGRADRDREARDRGARRATRHAERRAARAHRRAQRPIETEQAHETLARALELGGESGSPSTRAWTLRARREAGDAGGPARRGRRARSSRLAALFAESGVALQHGRTLNSLGPRRPGRRAI